MANVCKFSSYFVIFLAPLVVHSVETNSDDYMRREHSLIKPYQGPLWDFKGSTMVTNNFVRLTPDKQSQQGGIWNALPCYVRDWEIHITFKVHGAGKELFGDGFAFWYTKERLQGGAVFGSVDYFTGLAVFFDTYANQNGPHNHGHPYISAMVNNGSSHYDHDRDGTHTELAGCEAQFRNSQFDTSAAIRYSDNTVTVSTDIDGKNTWTECFRRGGVHLPTGYYLGATAATGELADNHDILSIKFYELTVQHVKDDVDYTKVEPEASFFAPPRDHIDDPKGAFMASGLSGWRLLIVILLLVVGVGVCVMVGFLVFQKRQEDSRKRFY